MRVFGLLFWLGFLVLRASAGDGGTFYGKNLGGAAILGEDGTPLSKGGARVELLAGTNVVAAGQFVKDGYFALGSILVGPWPTQVVPILVRVWDSSVGDSFDAAMIAGHGFGAAVVPITLNTGTGPGMDLVRGGFTGFSLVKPSPLPHWIDSEAFIGAVAPSKQRQTLTVTNQFLFAASDVASYRFAVTHPMTVSFTLFNRPTLHPLLRVFDDLGVELTRAHSGVELSQIGTNGTYSTFVHSFIRAGNYHLTVSADDNGEFPLRVNSSLRTGSSFGTFSLAVGPDASGMIHTASGIAGDFQPSDQRIALIRTGPTNTILAGITTWILIHGWNGSATDIPLLDFSTNLMARRPHDQVLVLDWSSMADSGMSDPFSPAAAIVPVAEWTARVLLQRGLDGTQLNLVGHSFGAYIADEIAQRLPGGVNSIVALDPAANLAPNQFDPHQNGEINFQRDARISWAFHASAQGSERTPTTATEAFIVDLSTNSITSDPALFLFLRDAINGELDFGYPNLFTSDRLIEALPGPFKPDQFRSPFFFDSGIQGYEGLVGDGLPFNKYVVFEPVTLVPPISVLWETNGPVVVLGNGSWNHILKLYGTSNFKSWEFIQGVGQDYYGGRFPIPKTNLTARFFSLFADPPKPGN